MEALVIPFHTARRRRDCSGLSDQDCFAVAAAMGQSRQPLIPARDEDFDGSVIMALLPYGGIDGPDYVIRRCVGGFSVEGRVSKRTFPSLGELLEWLSRMTKN